MQWSWLQAFHLFADTFERWPLASTTDEIEVVECWRHGQFGGKRGPGKFPYSYVISVKILHTVFCTFLMNLAVKIWRQVMQYPLVDIFLPLSVTILVDDELIMGREKTDWPLLKVKRLKN